MAKRKDAPVPEKRQKRWQAKRGPEDYDPPIEIVAPATQTMPLVFASPHSGAIYPTDLKSASRLDSRALRRSEDSFVDALFAAAPTLGAPLLRALFPRVYVDPNREPFELDPAMFADPLPDYVKTRSARIAAGLGTVARVVANGENIYRGKLTFADASRRINLLYRPYHQALHGLLRATLTQFGVAILVDCHSMPSIGGPIDRDSGQHRVDFVLGDARGNACAAVVTDTAAATLAALGYRVRRNDPYAGGFTTRHYGRPAMGLHALQIEINRALYMDENRITRLPGFAALADDLGRLIAALGEIDFAALLPRRAAAE